MQKKTPERRCTGCGETLPKKDLIRVVREPDGAISIDLVGKKSGRGAYICKDAKCLATAQKAKRLERAFECSIPEEVYERLKKEIDGE